MIVTYDRNPNLTEDQKLQSLTDSIQLALQEVMSEIDKINKQIETIKEQL